MELGPADAINTAIASWSQALAEEKSSPAAATLRQLVWEPIERQLPRETKTVYLCPEGSLTRLCWAALPGRAWPTHDGRGPGRSPGRGAGPRATTDRVLLEDYALALVPSGQFLLEQWTAPQPPAAERGTFLAVGDVTYDAQPAPARPAPTLLAAAGLRSAAIGDRQAPMARTAGHRRGAFGRHRRLPRAGPQLRAAFAGRGRPPTASWPSCLTPAGPTSPPTASSPTRSSVRRFNCPRAPSEQQTGLGQGQRSTVAGRNPLVLSGLVLAGANLPRQKDEFGVPQGDGGILTAEAIATLPLDNLELAVLSACETGLGDVAGGEGVFGLQRAFHIAGARNVVASLWKVDDQATATLMQLFYRNLWHGPRSVPPLVALREAQLALYHHPQWLEHPELIGGTGGQRAPDFSRRVGPGSPRRPAAPPEARPRGLPPKYWAAFVLSGSGQ